MTIAKPNAAKILSSMAAGSLYGLGAYRLYELNLPPVAREIFAILFVGFLMQFASVLIRKKLELSLLFVCFSAAFAGGVLTNNQLASYPTLTYIACTVVALILCDKTIKSFT